MAKRVAIFGSKGYLGTQIGFYLARRGFECEGFDLPEVDITDISFWERFSAEQYESILFFSGLTGTSASNRKPDLYVRVNEGGLSNLLARISSLGGDGPKIIFPSTRLVYKGSDDPLSEDSEKECRTVYARNKLNCESMLAKASNRTGLHYAVLRICVPYGNICSHDYSYGTLGFMMKQAAAGQITLYGTGEQKRTFTHVKDICRSVLALMEHPAAEGIFNMGGEHFSLREVAIKIATRYGAEISYVAWPEEALQLESGSTMFDSKRLDALTGGCRECLVNII